MKNYTLRNDETVLFQGEVSLLTQGKKVGDYKEEKAELILTNINIVVTVNKKALFTTNTETNEYSVKDIKEYEGTFQIIRKKRLVNVYLYSAELSFKFGKEKDAKDFCDKAQRVASGNSKFVRAVKKTRQAIEETNEALDINLANIAKNTAAIAGVAVVAASEVSGAGKKTRMLGSIVKAIAKSKSTTPSLPEAKVKKDSGIQSEDSENEEG